MTDATLTFYTQPMSRGRIVRWMLEEVGAPYETVIVPYERMKDEAYHAINPMGKVPALHHGDALVTETAAICAYLADAFPDAGLAPPPGSAARGPYYRWLFFGAGPVEAAVTNRALGLEVPADKQGFVGYGNHTLVLDTLEQAVAGGGWLTGDGFTAADLYISAHLMWGMAFGTIDKRDAFAAYAERGAARPAYQRASAIDDALLPAKEG